MSVGVSLMGTLPSWDLKAPTALGYVSKNNRHWSIPSFASFTIFHHLSISFLKFIIADLGMQWDAIREFRCLHQKAPATLWDGFPRQRQGKDHITQVPRIFAHLFGRHWSRFSSFPEWKSRDKHIAKTNNLLLASTWSMSISLLAYAHNK